MNKYINKYKNKDGYTVYKIEATSCCGQTVEWLRGMSPEVCPFCKNKYYKKPDLEMKLFTLQDEFLSDYNATGSTRVLGNKMFPLIQQYAKNFIKRMIKGKTMLRTDEIEIRSWDAATMLLEVILKDNEHKMYYSFGEYLKRICKGVCFGTQNHDRTYSLNSMLCDDKTELGETLLVNVEDVQAERDTRFFEAEDVKADDDNKLIEKLIAVIENDSRSISKSATPTQRLLYLQGMLLKIKKQDNVFEKFSHIVPSGIIYHIKQTQKAIEAL